MKCAHAPEGDSMCKVEIGDGVHKDFPGHGVFAGHVVSVEVESGTRKHIYRIRYDDGDEEDLYREEAVLLLDKEAERRAKSAARAYRKPKRPSENAVKGEEKTMKRRRTPQAVAERTGIEAALAAARKSAKEGGVPIGAALVDDTGVVLGQGHNQRVQKGDPILHGETACLQNAGRLPASVYRRCTMVTTLSPCAMCTGAMLLFKVRRNPPLRSFLGL